MNSDSAGTRYPHLDLETLVAEASGQPIDDHARGHLASCEACQREAGQWNLIADGVRGLAADVPEAGPQATRPGRPGRAGRRVLARPVRLALAAAASVAAAFVVLLGAGTAAGLVHWHLPGSGSGSGTILTSVNGCAQLEQTAGTLERVGDGSVVIKTASGQLVTVTITAATKLAASGALLGEVTDGATVAVAGTGSGGPIAADFVIVGGNPTLNIPGVATVRGTVADAGEGGFTVVTSTGTRVPVTTTDATEVTVSNAGVGQLQSGASTIALGHAGPDGTLSGLAVVQPPDWPAGAHASASVRSCSHKAISDEVMALAGG
jgi:predicted anti-sigma-YlaC factor YlaD